MVITVRFLMETCIELGIAAMITIRIADSERWNYSSERADLLFAYLTIVLLVITPFVVYHYGRRLVYRSLGMYEHEKEAVESLFE